MNLTNKTDDLQKSLQEERVLEGQGVHTLVIQRVAVRNYTRVNFMYRITRERYYTCTKLYMDRITPT